MFLDCLGLQGHPELQHRPDRLNHFCHSYSEKSRPVGCDWSEWARLLLSDWVLKKSIKANLLFVQGSVIVFIFIYTTFMHIYLLIYSYFYFY